MVAHERGEKTARVKTCHATISATLLDRSTQVSSVFLNFVASKSFSLQIHEKINFKALHNFQRNDLVPKPNSKSSFCYQVPAAEQWLELCLWYSRYCFKKQS